MNAKVTNSKLSVGVLASRHYRYELWNKETSFKTTMQVLWGRKPRGYCRGVEGQRRYSHRIPPSLVSCLRVWQCLCSYQADDILNLLCLKMQSSLWWKGLHVSESESCEYCCIPSCIPNNKCGLFFGILRGAGWRDGGKSGRDRCRHLCVATAVEFLAQARLAQTDRSTLLVLSGLFHLFGGQDLVAADRV